MVAPGPLHVLHVCSNSVVQMGILRSQVVEPMRRLARDQRLRITIVSSERVGERDPEAERALAQELGEAGLELLVVAKRVGPALRHRRPSPLRRAMAPLDLWADVRGLRRVITALARERQPCVVHARSYIPAWAALGPRTSGLCRLVFDPRGVLPEELAFAQGWRAGSWRLRLWKRLERRILARADALIALSQPMAEHCRAIGGPPPIVIPCCVDLDRFHPGERVPLPEDPLRLVLLVGVDVPYQALEQALRVREALARLWPGGAVLRIESPDAEAIARRVGGPEVICAASPREAIPPLLARSDIGVLTRTPSLISRVASPVKFAEYLAAGLPVVATAGIGECDRILREGRCGVSLDPSDSSTWDEPLKALVQGLARDRAGLRQAARAAAETHFGWDRYLPLLREAYGLPPGDVRVEPRTTSPLPQ